MLFAAFRRPRPALIIFANVPFATVGGMNRPRRARHARVHSAAVGFIALSGVAVLNGVVLMSRLTELEESGLSPAEAATGAARERARPVLMTALVSALGFLPMAVATGVGAEVQRPLATVVAGGPHPAHPARPLPMARAPSRAIARSAGGAGCPGGIAGMPRGSVCAGRQAG